ncbi:hypothetical protein B0J18DRAFT_477350 [Chaetomium sp. MPI-SDFR-AT-0129]|nr:hypothetical protein B0J18DRAFT_477350 [Chaetomium sp. MPI-SDFR-AT-0129]
MAVKIQVSNTNSAPQQLSKEAATIQLTALTLLAGAVASVSAAALAPRCKTGGTFTLIAWKEGSPIDGKTISATHSKLWVARPDRGPDERCHDGKLDNGAAVFLLSGREVLLYGGSDGVSTQTLAVHRSGPGKGNLKFFTIVAGLPPPRPFETSGWSIERSTPTLFYDGRPFLGCPELDGSYSVYVYYRGLNDRPGGRRDCVQFDLEAREQPYPVPCIYSEGPI